MKDSVSVTRFHQEYIDNSAKESDAQSVQDQLNELRAEVDALMYRTAYLEQQSELVFTALGIPRAAAPQQPPRSSRSII